MREEGRAILQVAEQPGGHVGSGARKLLRSVNHTLSRLRDADAMVVTLAGLRKRNPHLFSDQTFARMQHRLLAHKRAAKRAANSADAWKKVDRPLRKLQRAVKQWQPAPKGFDALLAGCRSSHRAGRRAMRCALKTQLATDFHEWRKRIKTLWYALRLIEDTSADVRRDIRALHRAETALGNEHNVVVLCAELTKDGRRSPLDLDRARVAADRYQGALRTRAIASATRIYRRTPSACGRSLERAWKAWRRERASPRRRGHRRTP